MRAPVRLAAALVLAAQMGCLLWPFPTGQLLSGRGRIRPVDTEPLVVGQATREDVLLRLGEPDRVLEGGRILVYRWTEVRGFLAFGGNGGAVAIPFPGHRQVRLEFGPDGRLARVATQAGAEAA
jgi:hypothetical protein